MARGLYQKIDLDEMVKMVVVVWSWRWRCGDSRWKRWMVARVLLERERERMKMVWYWCCCVRPGKTQGRFVVTLLLFSFYFLSY